MNLLLCASVLSATAVRNNGAYALVQLRGLFSVPSERAGPTSRRICSTRPSQLLSRHPQRGFRTDTEDRPGKTSGRDIAAGNPAYPAPLHASSDSAHGDGGDDHAPEQIVTVCGETETEETIKKSRFIGRCGPAATFEEGKALLGRVLQEHPKARHSCWAWRGLGDDHRFSDDGEPGGTAGQPILGGIESEGVSEVMVVVTRYSGGIKLGTGGLCRAYGGGSRLCLQAAERETRTPMLTLRVRAPVDSVGGVYHAVSNCERLSEEFTADGRVVLRIAVELAQVDDARRRLQDATKGAAEIVEETNEPVV